MSSDDRTDDTGPAMTSHRPYLLRALNEWIADNGMTPPQARTLALDRSVDVHWVVEKLLKRGCDPAVAFDISSGVMAA